MSNLGDVEPESDMYPRGYVGKLVHELRTPLTALRGSLGLLASVIDDASSDVKSFATIAERNASKLAGMLDDLAELERIRGGSAAVRVESVDLVDIIETVALGLETEASQAQIRIDTYVGVETVSTDGAILKSLLTRVVGYAVRMSAPGSSVRVHARSGVHAVLIEIRDLGKDAPPEGQEIFEPFSLIARRGHDPAARPGLDLTIARALAGLLGAALTFTSTLDGGIFSLSIPN